MPVTQPSHTSPTEYMDVLKNKAIQCDRVYDEYLGKVIFIEKLSELTRHGTRSYWGSRNKSTVQELVSHVTSLTELQHGSQSTDAPRHNDKTETDVEVLDCMQRR